MQDLLIWQDGTTYSKNGSKEDVINILKTYQNTMVDLQMHLNLIVGILIQHHCKPGQQLES